MCTGVAADHRVELQNTEAQFRCLFQAVAHQRLSQPTPPGPGGHSVAGIADVAAAAHIVGTLVWTDGTDGEVTV